MPPVDDSPLDPPEEIAPQEPAAPASDPGMSPAEVAQLVADANAPLFEQISQLTSSIHSMAQSQQREAPPGESTDFLTELTTGNPEEAVARLVNKQLQTISPFLANMAKSGSGAFLSLEAQQVDAAFGEGAWAAYIEKPMGVLMQQHAQNNPAALADSDLIHREVNGLKGELIDTLVKHRDEYRAKMENSEKEKLAKLTESVTNEAFKRTNGIGGIRRIESGDVEITDDVRGYLDERSRAIGKSYDPKQWIKETDYGNTLADFRRKQADLKGNGAAQ